MVRFLTAISAFPGIRDLIFPLADMWHEPDPLRRAAAPCRQRRLRTTAGPALGCGSSRSSRRERR